MTCKKAPRSYRVALMLLAMTATFFLVFFIGIFSGNKIRGQDTISVSPTTSIAPPTVIPTSDHFSTVATTTVASASIRPTSIRPTSIRPISIPPTTIAPSPTAPSKTDSLATIPPISVAPTTSITVTPSIIPSSKTISLTPGGSEEPRTHESICPDFNPGIYEAETCWQSDSGYRNYGVQVKIPPDSDCTSGTDCLFSYPGLQCHGFVTYIGSCGDNCLKFKEHYLVETGCLTSGTSIFTLQETGKGEYVLTWSITSASTVAICENVSGPALGCDQSTEPTVTECRNLPSGVYSTTKCQQNKPGLRDYGVKIEIPPHSDCSSSSGSQRCLFSYPGLSCHGYALFDGTCGDGCFQFTEHYIVTTGCLTTGSPSFTLQERADGEYRFDWSTSGASLTSTCDNVQGPSLVCYE